MKTIRKQAQLARRRLTSERFLQILPWSWLTLLGVATLGLALPIFVAMPIDKPLWYGSWLIGATVIAFVFSVIMAFISRPSLANSAMEIDRRFGLRERLSSVLYLSNEDRETELGQALEADAEKRAGTIDVRDHFRWGANRALWLPALPGLLAVALWFAPLKEATEEATTNSKASINQVKNATKPLIEQIRKKREEAEKQGLNEAVDMFRKLEGELAKLQKDTKLDTKQTLAKLNDIKEQLEKRKEELGSSDALKKNLAGLEKFEKGPADKLADAMKKGDFEQAQNELDKLLEKLSEEGGLNKEDMQKLEKQLEQLEQALRDAAQKHEMAKQALEQQLKQAEAAGDMQKAAEMARKLEQMQASDQKMQELQNLADSLSQCKDCMKSGDKQAAKDALSKMASQLSKMNQENNELQDLDQLMDSLSQSKSQMKCSSCDGAGCAKCMGSKGMMGEMPGRGLGEGQGEGDRPEEETDAEFFESRVRDQMRQGETIYGGKVGGANRKGTTKSEVQEAVLSSLTEEPEPLENQPLPRAQREHTREYFNKIRDGK